VVKDWSDVELARRWLMLCPERRDEKRQPLEPTEFEINSIVNNKEKLATVRSRLSDLSWWMRLLSQNIAQRANKAHGRNKLTKPNCLEPEALADLLPSNRLASQAQRVLFILSLA
jgi:hypothetical protein